MTTLFGTKKMTVAAPQPVAKPHFTLVSDLLFTLRAMRIVHALRAARSPHGPTTTSIYSRIVVENGIEQLYATPAALNAPEPPRCAVDLDW
jgi:hypothetical protein